MKCIECKELNSCGTVKKWLINFNKETLVKELNKECKNQDCKDFSFIAISGTVLRDKILEMTKLSYELKTSLKQAKNKKK